MGTLTTLAQQCSLSEHRHTSDPFEYVDGHYVGHDGFVVPKDFAEFYERFPQHIRGWVKRHAGRCSSEDIDEWTQELCVHMSSLPARSEHRNSGKRDVIETFDPVRQYGANLPRFLNYVNYCLANRFRTIHSKRLKNPISRAEPLFSSQAGRVESADDEPHNALLERLNVIDRRSRKDVEDKLRVREFAEFLRVEKPRLLWVLGAIAISGTQAEAARRLRATGAEVARLYRQIRALGRDFLNQKAGTRRSRCSETRNGTNANTSISESVSRPVQLGGESTTCWNRVDLYTEVWSLPLVKLSRKYGISDVRLGNVCRKLKIPHPGRGYWAKRSVGQTVEQVPLPEFKDAPVVRRLKTRSSRRKQRPQLPRGSQERISGLSGGTTIRVRISTR